MVFVYVSCRDFRGTLKNTCWSRRSRGRLERGTAAESVGDFVCRTIKTVFRFDGNGNTANGFANNRSTQISCFAKRSAFVHGIAASARRARDFSGNPPAHQATG